MVQVDVQSPGDVEELQGMLGLGLQLDTGGKDWQAAPAPHVPCQAPFTSMLPDIMRLAHRSAQTMLATTHRGNHSHGRHLGIITLKMTVTAIMILLGKTNMCDRTQNTHCCHDYNCITAQWEGRRA